MELTYDAVIIPNLYAVPWSGDSDVAFEPQSTMWLEEALRGHYSTDAMFQPVAVPGARGPMPRLGRGADQTAMLTWVVFDLDRPTPWGSPDDVEGALAPTVRSVGVRVGAAPWAYSTPSGLRLLWKLSKPVPVSGTGSLLRKVARVALPRGEAAGCYLDLVQADQWFKVYRLPSVRRGDTFTRPVMFAGEGTLKVP